MSGSGLVQSQEPAAGTADDDGVIALTLAYAGDDPR